MPTHLLRFRLTQRKLAWVVGTTISSISVICNIDDRRLPKVMHLVVYKEQDNISITELPYNAGPFGKSSVLSPKLLL